ncbi:MAG: hypothetical protein CME72_12775 [Halomonadaceae bacterium]|nr:hypothetical protein [Halomonadaceae bacterium]
MQKLMFTAAIIAVSILGAGSLFAQEDAQNEKAQPNGMQGNMMNEGGVHGNMMGQMSSMMEKCNTMMEMMKNKQSEGA